VCDHDARRSDHAPVEKLGDADSMFWRGWKSRVAIVVAVGVCAPFVSNGAAFASASDPVATVGMPFTGTWASNVLVNPPYTTDNSSYPAVHPANNGGDWATDLYAAEGTPVTLQVTSPDGPVTFTWESSTTSCGTSSKVDVFVNGGFVGWIYYGHVQGGRGTNTADPQPTNGTTLGTVHDWGNGCNDGPHVHIELSNASASTYACWTDNGQPGVTLSQGASLGLLGSLNNGPKQACTGAPPTAPSAPSGVSATPGNGAATVTWSPPSSDGGAPLTGYVVTAFIAYFAAAQATFSSSATSGTVGGLSNGTTYRFQVAATNAVATGSSSRASNAVVAGAPGPPTGVKATAGNGQATIRWTAPATNNGSAIAGYVVTPSLAGVPRPAVTFTSAATTETIAGLSNAKSYTFSVAAKNANGVGSQSSASPAVTVGTPLAPTNATATPGNGKAIVSWTAPTSGNGSPISGYVVTAFIGFAPAAQMMFASTATTETFAGLSNGTTYRFKVAATNANGTGSPSSATGPVVPS
jgi:Fibronectin type III domain